ncbi:lipocalin-like domain-containing protein [Rubrivivax sp. A210]|uniref:lipocalin-like domain-containing protein n=1 Tax=Rubrivivax sp. A210 TaxID=2772301 RepID=UPI00191AB804|nr:lipocalin-like domain-containing protein [Rubrivivax sp. A210]
MGIGSAQAGAVQRGRVLAWPRDHGAHLEARTEWWYATGWLGLAGGAPALGFQLTFFRSRTGLAEGLKSRFAARHLLFAHAAVTLLGEGRHLHDQRVARWSGAADSALGHASTSDGAIALGGWTLRHDGQAWQARLPAQGFALDLNLARSQPLLLQGEAGWSRKGPQEAQASHYVSEPQLLARGRATAGAAVTEGRAWMDHEWSDELLHPEAVGWDWLGINLFDGSALTAFVLRRRDGSVLWAGGSWRVPGQPGRSFTPQEISLRPGRRWLSPSSGARYPVQWQVDTPQGRYELRALLDAQELDSRASTGTIYWEGLSELLGAGGRRVGLGYLEMTGYAAALRL